MIDEKEEPESLVIPYEDSSILLYRAPSIREKQTVRRCVERLAAILKELIVEEEDLEVMFGKLRGKYYKHYPKFGEGAWLRKGRNFDVVLWDEGNGCYTVFAVIFRSRSLYEWVKEVY
jgi:hypothetical protein